MSHKSVRPRIIQPIYFLLLHSTGKAALCDHPHIFDLIRHLTGSSFDYIYAEVAPNLRDGLKVEDMLMAVGKMKDGTAFLFDPSWSRLEGYFEECGFNATILGNSLV